MVGQINDPWVRFGRWYFSDPDTRTMSPWSRRTNDECLQDLLINTSANTLDLAQTLAAQIAAKRAALAPPPATPSPPATGP